MGSIEDARVGTELAQTFEHSLHIATLPGTREELAIGECPCPTFAKAIVGVGVNTLLTCDERHIATTIAHRATTLDKDGTNTQFDEPKGRKQSTGT